MIDWTEIRNGEDWESFARDFLVSLGLRVVAEPGRGADGGRDLILSEHLKGEVSVTSQTWLVSCKHFAKSRKSVTPDDEPSILDRVKQHKVDGFMGFYSTLPSNALVDRLRGMRADAGPSYHLWDSRSLEGSLLNRNQTDLMLRYLPESFAKLRPIAPILGEQLELPCEICGKDALKASVGEQFSANVLFAQDNDQKIQRVLIACKGTCDPILDCRLLKQGMITAWEDVTDLCNPLIYLRRLFATMNSLRERPEMFSDKAYAEMQHIYTAFAQRTLRAPLPSDEARYMAILPLEGF